MDEWSELMSQLTIDWMTEPDGSYAVIMHPGAYLGYKQALYDRKRRRKMMVSRDQWKFSQGRSR